MYNRNKYLTQRSRYTVYSVRVPKDSCVELRQAASTGGVSINEFIISAIEWAIENSRRSEPPKALHKPSIRSGMHSGD